MITFVSGNVSMSLNIFSNLPSCRRLICRNHSITYRTLEADSQYIYYLHSYLFISLGYRLSGPGFAVPLTFPAFCFTKTRVLKLLFSFNAWFPGISGKCSFRRRKDQHICLAVLSFLCFPLYISPLLAERKCHLPSLVVLLVKYCRKFHRLLL